MQATHGFDAASEKELSLAVGDYVVVRKVQPSYPVNPCYSLVEICFIPLIAFTLPVNLSCVRKDESVSTIFLKKISGCERTLTSFCVYYILS